MLRLNMILTLVLIIITACIQGGQGVSRGRSRSPPRADLLKTIKLRIYYGSLDNYAEYLLDSEADNLLRDKRFNSSKPTVFYFHGYTEDANKESVKTVVSAFIRQDKFNIVFVDWSKVAAEFYVIPLLLTPEVGKLVAKQLDAWHQSGNLSISRVYLVGHSLGGQAAGFTGKFLTKAKVPRITALDPALPGFNVKSLTTSHITESDGQFVDVIHTDSGNYGVNYPTGHVDFYPNGGRRLQPGCPAGARILSDEDFCSHWRSWRFFAESLDSSATPFYGLACPTQEDFVAGKCKGNARAVMGFNTPFNTRGTFFLETHAAAPYSKGKFGLKSTITAEEAGTPRPPESELSKANDRQRNADKLPPKKLRYRKRPFWFF